MLVYEIQHFHKNLTPGRCLCFMDQALLECHTDMVWMDIEIGAEGQGDFFDGWFCMENLHNFCEQVSWWTGKGLD